MPDREPSEYSMEEWRELNAKMATFVALRKVWEPMYGFVSEIALGHDGPLTDMAIVVLREAKKAADKVRY